MKKVNSQIKRQENEDNNYIESLLRPTSWPEYIGQEKIKKNLNLILTAAQKRGEPIDHLLFYGQAGLGKTTLTTLVAKEMKANLKIATGPSLERIGDLAALLSDLEAGDILFIDEAHRLNPALEEALYPAMESRKFHLMIGKGLGSRLVSLDLPPFTLIAATTRVNLLSSPLRSRFGAVFHFDYYEIKDIEAIIQRSAKILNLTIEPGAIDIIAGASRFTPRIANRLLKRNRDFIEVNNLKIVDAKVSSEVLELLGIDVLGLESCERRLLETIIKKFNNRPVGINNLTAALNEERGVIEEIYEPYLIKLGFIQRTPQGRITTKLAYKHLNIQAPNPKS